MEFADENLYPGKFLCILPEELADQALQVLRSDPLGGHAARIGEVRSGRPGRVVLQTALGGSRLMDMLEGNSSSSALIHGLYALG